MNPNTNQEDINVTTKNIIKSSNNQLDNNLAIHNAFVGDIDSVHVGDNVSHFGFKERSIRRLPPDIISVPFHPESFQSEHQDARGRTTATQTGNIGKRVELLLREHSVPETMVQAADFRKDLSPLVQELTGLLDLQYNAHQSTSNALTIETNTRMGQSFLTRFFKSDQEKRLIETLEKNKKYAKYYHKLLNKILSQLKQYPVNEEEKKRIIDAIRLDIQELTLQKKELGVNARSAALKKSADAAEKNNTRGVKDKPRNTKSDNSRNASNQSNSNNQSSDGVGQTIKDLFEGIPLRDNNMSKKANNEGFNVFSLSGKNKGLLDFENDGLLSFNDIDRTLNNFFYSNTDSNASSGANAGSSRSSKSSKSSKSSNSSNSSASSNNKQSDSSAVSRWSNRGENASKSSSTHEQEAAELEIDKKIIALERRIIALERFQ